MSHPTPSLNHTGGDAIARRRFLQRLGVAAGLAAAPGAALAAPPVALDEPVTDDRRWGLHIDTSKCDPDCNACVEACDAEHGLTGHDRPLTDAQWIRSVELENKSTGHRKSLPVMCQHCSNPPCVDVCPTGASFRRVDGIVLVDKHICIGCRYCLMACPYKARNFVHEDLHAQKPYSPRGKGTAEACTLCVHRIDAGRPPACVEACSSRGGGAMTFGDLKDPDSAVAQARRAQPTRAIRADLGTDPGVRYSGL